MKAQSFEYQLQHAIAPMPDPVAHLLAKTAAVAEFERVHGAAGRAISPPAASDAGSWLRRLFLRGSRRQVASNRGSRNLLLGGFASACVVVIAVSTYWLVPPGQRQVLVPPPIVSRVEPEVRGDLAPPVAKASDADLLPPPVVTEAKPEPPRTETVAPAGTVQQQKTPRSRVTHPKGPSLPAQTGASPAAAPEPSEVGITTTANEAEIVVAADKTPATANAGTSTPIAALPAVTNPAVTNHGVGSELNEIIVTGARRKSWLGGLFSRNEAAPTQQMSLPPGYIAEGRDKFEHFEVNPVKRVADEPVSTFSADVDTASYSFVRRELNGGRLPQVDSVRVEEMINYFDYTWPASDSRDQPFKPTVTVSDSPWGEGKKLIHIGIKGYELPVRQQPDVNLVLLLDVSGSMDEPDKLPLAQKSMALLLDTLKPTDTVAIVVYAGAAGEVLPPTAIKDKETILQALNSLQPGGSTAGAEGIKLAYALAERNFRKDGVNRILLATDGDFNVGITNQNELKGFVEREREKGVFLSFLGFGEGNYHDEMGQVLAQNGNGVAAYIDTLNEAKKVLVQESTASLFTIAKDVKFQVEFNPATVAEYRLIGYETRALKREDFNNDKVDAGDVGSGHAVTAIYEITPVGSKAKLIDERRYGESEETHAQSKATEYGFLKIRYKLPNGIRSRLIEQPIRIDAGVPEALRSNVEFSTAVAGFGQLLRGGKYTGPLKFDDVIRQARGALGEDPFGYRAEFVSLAHKAKDARGM
jgi:Ca-activated chloride channel homolog